MKSALFFLVFLSGCITAAAQPSLFLSEDMVLTRIASHAWVHTSVADLDGFPGVSSNGMVIVSHGEALLLDTPANNTQTERLVRFLTDSLHVQVTGFVPNHWHQDCMGGLGWLQTQGIPSYANRLTIEEARRHGKPLPDHAFRRSKKLRVGDLTVYCRYEGGGHTSDHTVVWIPTDGIFWGGCLVKDTTTRKLVITEGADLEAWPRTLDRIRRKYRRIRIVVPGHGPWGGTELLEWTSRLIDRADDRHSTPQ